MAEGQSGLTIRVTDADVAMIRKGLGWAIGEGALEPEATWSLVEKLGIDLSDWKDIYGPYDEGGNQ